MAMCYVNVFQPEPISIVYLNSFNQCWYLTVMVPQNNMRFNFSGKMIEKFRDFPKLLHADSGNLVFYISQKNNPLSFCFLNQGINFSFHFLKLRWDSYSRFSVFSLNP